MRKKIDVFDYSEQIMKAFAAFPLGDSAAEMMMLVSIITFIPLLPLCVKR